MPKVDPSVVGVIRFLEDRVGRDPGDVIALNRLSGEYLSRFRETGDDRDLTLADKAAMQSLASVPAELNTAALAARARAALALHRFAAVRDDATVLVRLAPDKSSSAQLLGDAELELGNYAAAGVAYEKCPALSERDAATEARLGRLELMRGNLLAARKHLDDAVDFSTELLPPQPLLVAYCRVQSGQLAFSTGDWPAAEKEYLAALDDRPGDWSAIDHLAELRAAQKRFDESISLYRQLVERIPRPELFQALGDVYRISGNAAESKGWYDRARVAYLKSTEEGAVHYYHHLAGFFCDAQPNAAEALKWAKKDLELRGGFYAHDGLAWALYQSRDFVAAAKEMDVALSTHPRDAHVLYHAALIYRLAGEVKKAQESLALAGEINSQFNAFHVHR